MKSNAGLIWSLTCVALASLACGMLDSVTDQLPGGDAGMTAVASLWDDVPPMDGMGAAQQIEMPLWLKTLARPIMDTMMRGLNDGQDAGHWDWTSFALDGRTPADVQAFYTPERMAGFGWQQAEAACLPMAEQSVMCSFTKEAGGQTTGLIVIAAADDQQQSTSVFFLRATGVSDGAAAGEPVPNAAPLALIPIPPIFTGGGLAQIDVCQAIPQQDIEAVMGRSLVKAPERFEYFDTADTSGCSYEAEKDADGEAHFGYVALTRVDTYLGQPLYLNEAVGGLGQEAYFNNGAAARELWVKVNDNVAFVIAFGDLPLEDGSKQLAALLVAAIQ
jgi:hypothetical protein